MSPDIFVKSFFSVIDSADWEAVQAFFHANVVYSRPGYPELQGRARVMDFYRHERMISQGRHYVEGVVALGSEIACWGLFSGTLKSGEQVSVRFADVYQTEEGGIIKRETFFSRPAV
ncbi:nuclear transport factor 2 family protein [Burkholderia gladioli]|uniref:SnoaL-like domain-containing protein n=1 Tax=Burkholderia gladioli (strain BSR3) TaxID=999541 RepID=F2LT85_BURGS|nr:nuclear transport factor 2 family protein [Burkholderia gladioli]AEA66031.1 hypothetical protein bgla_4p2720 [Burkholderia gladioli BSR3]MBW5285064.1 nuclear transport factor 2 family protein [Burkholderia gladioli]